MEPNKKLFKKIVLILAKESKCQSYQVGCIAVKDNRIVASGVNGTSPGSENCKDYMLRKYNSLLDMDEIPKIEYEEWEVTKHWREVHHAFSDIKEIHGEQSILIDSSRRGISIKDCDIYVSHMPCIQCAKLLSFVGPRAIYYVNDYDKAKKESQELFKEAGIHLERI